MTTQAPEILGMPIPEACHTRVVTTQIERPVDCFSPRIFTPEEIATRKTMLRVGMLPEEASGETIQCAQKVQEALELGKRLTELSAAILEKCTADCQTVTEAMDRFDCALKTRKEALRDIRGSLVVLAFGWNVDDAVRDHVGVCENELTTRATEHERAVADTDKARADTQQEQDAASATASDLLRQGKGNGGAYNNVLETISKTEKCIKELRRTENDLAEAEKVRLEHGAVVQQAKQALAEREKTFGAYGEVLLATLERYSEDLQGIYQSFVTGGSYPSEEVPTLDMPDMAELPEIPVLDYIAAAPSSEERDRVRSFLLGVSFGRETATGSSVGGDTQQIPEQPARMSEEISNLYAIVQVVDGVLTRLEAEQMTVVETKKRYLSEILTESERHLAILTPLEQQVWAVSEGYVELAGMADETWCTLRGLLAVGQEKNIAWEAASSRLRQLNDQIQTATRQIGEKISGIHRAKKTEVDTRSAYLQTQHDQQLADEEWAEHGDEDAKGRLFMTYESYSSRYLPVEVADTLEQLHQTIKQLEASKSAYEQVREKDRTEYSVVEAEVERLDREIGELLALSSETHDSFTATLERQVRRLDPILMITRPNIDSAEQFLGQVLALPSYSEPLQDAPVITKTDGDSSSPQPQDQVVPETPLDRPVAPAVLPQQVEGFRLGIRKLLHSLLSSPKQPVT